MLATIVVVGLLSSSLSAEQYFASPGTWRYLANIALLEELFLPGVFEGMRELGAVNGSLWSLLPEFLCYLTVPLFALLPYHLRLGALPVVAALLGGIGLYLFEGYDGPAFVAYHMDVKYALVEAPFFFVGGLLRLLEGRVRGLYRVDLCLAFLTANYAVSSWLVWRNIPLEWFTLPYLVVCFGRMSLPVLNQAGRFGDLSYGLYLYAFPVQQLVLARWPTASYPVLTCVLLTTPIAFLSWHLIERSALRWRAPYRVKVRPSPVV